MSIFASPSTKLFYNDQINADIPSDSVEITNEQHMALLDGISNGKEIDFSQIPPALREPEKVWPTAQQLADLIDNKVAEIYNKWTRFTSEYQAKEAAALAYQQAGYEGETSGWISSYADSAGLDYKEATDRILAQAESLRSAQIQIGQLRMRKFELSALDDEARSELYELIIAEIVQVSATVEPIA